MKINLEEIEAKEKAATPGEWMVGRMAEDCSREQFLTYCAECWDKTPEDKRTEPLVVALLEAPFHIVAILGCGPTTSANADLIVNNRNSVLALVSRVREYQDLIEDALEGPLRFDDQAWCKKARAALEDSL